MFVSAFIAVELCTGAFSYTGKTDAHLPSAHSLNITEYSADCFCSDSPQLNVSVLPHVKERPKSPTTSLSPMRVKPSLHNTSYHLASI